MKELLSHPGAAGGGGVAALWPHDRTRPWLLPAAGLAHARLAFWLLLRPPAAAPRPPGSGFDPLARAMLPAVSLLFLGCAAVRRALPAAARRTAEPRVRGEFCWPRWA